MPDSPVFDAAGEALERLSSLDSLEARGTLRIALRDAGLDARSISKSQMEVVIERLLPGHLETRGIGDAAGVCAGVRQDLALAADAPATETETAEEVFARLGG